MIPAGIYLHVPFCRRRCFYCHFFKIEASAGRIACYLESLRQEITLAADPGQACDTIYFGGGSPSLLDPDQIEKLLTALRSSFHLRENSEVTLEANPEDLDLAQLCAYRAAGVNRLSLGVQSFSPCDLEWLGRRHSAATAQNAVEWARQAGLERISLDFIIGLPGQSRRTLEKNFERARSLGAGHLSVYLLEEVPQVRSERWERRAVALYGAAQNILVGLGYPQYEVSNFASRANRSRHNQKYWRGVRYFGLGPGASGFDGKTDRRNVRSLAAYHRRLAAGELPVAEKTTIPAGWRRIATGLRTTDGVPERFFAGRERAVSFLENEQLLVRRHGQLAVPPASLLLLNEILVELAGPD